MNALSSVIFHDDQSPEVLFASNQKFIQILKKLMKGEAFYPSYGEIPNTSIEKNGILVLIKVNDNRIFCGKVLGS